MSGTGDTELDRKCDEYLAESRAHLASIRPQLLLLKEVYETYIERIGAVLFVGVPQTPSGRHVTLSADVEKECEAACVRVLKKRLALVNKALGIK